MQFGKWSEKLDTQIAQLELALEELEGETIVAAARRADPAEVRGQQPEIRRRSRQDRTQPLIDELRQTLDDALRRLSPKSEMAKAIAYGRKRWVALTRFLDDGHLEIDNNIAERAMRCVALGRKTACSLAQRRAAIEPLPSIPSSRAPNSMASNHRPISPTSSPRSWANGLLPAGMNSCRGTGGQINNRSPKPPDLRPPAHLYPRSSRAMKAI